MNRKRASKHLNGIIIATALLVALTVLLAGCDANENVCDTADATWDSLEDVLRNRRREVVSHLKSLHEIALQADKDSTLVAWFDRIHDLSREHALSRTAPQLQAALDRHFVENYGAFYDLLFIDTAGFVFHSIRQESDFRRNLLRKAPECQLARRLAQAPEPGFAGFEYYLPSREPASFHLVPVEKDGSCRGWFVFQQAINSLNAILTDYEGLGRTGEVYLVGSDSLMLSNSRFCGEGTILRRRVSTDAVVRAMAGSQGRAVIDDYRGVPVFSVFQPLGVLGCEWIIVAEMDQSEVLDRVFGEASESWRTGLLATEPEAPPDQALADDPRIKVDMHEFALTDSSGRRVFTGGVATCTAVALTYPGRFAALAHLGPTDKANTDRLTRWGLRGRGSDLVGDMMRRISRFEIHPYEIDSLEATIVAPHARDVEGIVTALMRWGIDLTRIRLLRKRAVLAADVSAAADGRVLVRWHRRGGNEPSWRLATAVPSLGELVLTESGCW
jgi:hypothetical protein